jgi:hypothetical protein
VRSPASLPNGSRAVNWGFFLMGRRPRSAREELQAARWLAAGGRAWTSEPCRTPAPGLLEAAEWFRVPSLTCGTASRYEIPHAMEGNPGAVLPCWTSEAARTFRIPRRGVISPGAVADLVLWKGDASGYPSDMRSLRPSVVILNGKLLDLDQPEPAGRFLDK